MKRVLCPIEVRTVSEEDHVSYKGYLLSMKRAMYPIPIYTVVNKLQSIYCEVMVK